MLIAQEKKQNNIAEYILYIWQLEDLLRANNLDMKLIEQNLISKYQQPPEVMSQIKLWYENFIAIIKTEKIENQGHTLFIKNTLNDLYYFHLQLIKSPQEDKYRQVYTKVITDIGEFQKKGNRFYDNELETMFTALYAVMLLKLQKKEISQGTQQAVNGFSELISMLAYKYHQNEQGNSELEQLEYE
jgi:hypothetical protein